MKQNQSRKEYFREWRRKNPEKCKETYQKRKSYFRKYREKNLEKSRKYHRSWASEHREKRKEYYRNYIEKLKRDPERYKTWLKRRSMQYKEYRLRNLEECRKRDKEHTQRKIAKMGRENYNKYRLQQYHKVREKIEGLLGNTCSICGYKPKKGQRRLQSHEIHGKKHESSVYYILSHIEDFVPLCKTCHQTVHFYHLYKKQFEKLEKILSEFKELGEMLSWEE